MDAIEFLKRLDLIGDPITWKRLPLKQVSALKDGTVFFDWFHLGTTNTTVREFGQLCSENFFTPPRTGHAGNWSSMIEGWAGALDYNTAVCTDSRFGAPLVFDWNQTETTDLTAGDTIYRPGSSASRTSAQQLELYCWNGQDFALVDHETSRFVPFVVTKEQGQFVGLAHWHRRRNVAENWGFIYWSDVVIENVSKATRLLARAIKSCVRAGSNLSLLIDRIAFHDGSTHRVDVAVKDNGEITVGDTTYSSVSALVDDCMIPFRAAASPHWWIENAKNQRSCLPLLSNYSTMAMYALLGTHFAKLSSWTDDVLVHPHWGAIGMAGFPPARHGYFGSQSRYMKKVMRYFLEDDGEYKSVIYLLAPAAIFLLLPREDSTGDKECVRNLLNVVTSTTQGLHPEEVTETLVASVVTKWISDSEGQLSSYWERRFQKQRSVGNIDSELTPSLPEVLPEFLDMSMRTLCLILSSLDGIYGQKI